MPVDCQNFLSTGLLQVVETTCSKSSSIRSDLHRPNVSWWNQQAWCNVMENVRQAGKTHNLHQACGISGCVPLYDEQIACFYVLYHTYRIHQLLLFCTNWRNICNRIVRSQCDHLGLWQRERNAQTARAHSQCCMLQFLKRHFLALFRIVGLLGNNLER